MRGEILIIHLFSFGNNLFLVTERRAIDVPDRNKTVPKLFIQTTLTHIAFSEKNYGFRALVSGFSLAFFTGFWIPGFDSEKRSTLLHLQCMSL